MDYSALRSEIDDDPAGKGYQQHLPDSPGLVVDLLNARTGQMVKPRMVTARAILADCGALAPSILDKLEAASASNSSVKWAVRFLQQEGGIDVGHPTTQAMIDQLTGPLFTPEEGAALKSMALQPASRAEVLGMGLVTESDLRTALES